MHGLGASPFPHPRGSWYHHHIIAVSPDCVHIKVTQQVKAEAQSGCCAKVPSRWDFCPNLPSPGAERFWTVLDAKNDVTSWGTWKMESASLRSHPPRKIKQQHKQNTANHHKPESTSFLPRGWERGGFSVAGLLIYSWPQLKSFSD